MLQIIRATTNDFQIFYQLIFQLFSLLIIWSIKENNEKHPSSRSLMLLKQLPKLQRYSIYSYIKQGKLENIQI